MDSALREATQEELLERLADGESLVAICKREGMPDRRTVQRWQDADEAFDAAITRAREIGYSVMAEKAVADAEDCEDPQKGRLAFDARRWYLGKLSNAFSDNKAQKHEVKHDMTDEAKQWLGQTS